FAPSSPNQSRRRAVYAGIAGLGIVALVAVAVLVAIGGAPAPGIEVISSPTGATVSIDGHPVPGVTPLTAHEGIESGRTYRVEVAMPGYQPWAAQLSPTQGTLRQFVVLAPMPATLRVETDPPGTQVMVNGVLRGEAPLDVTGLVVGQEIEVRALTAGRPPVIRRVRLLEGTTTERILVASP
ncbi:MAG: PEGA domain-containing protein, partial [Myxococcota bacterium]|nr:PEGA domain-containing protein [Myxococcota bacterium]